MLKYLWYDIKSADTGWLIIWSCIYIAFIFGDLVAPGFFGITILKLLGLFICFAYACHHSPADRLLAIALGLTFVADTILAQNNTSPWGVFVFCLVHFFHMARLTDIDLVDPRLFVAYLIGSGLIFLFGWLVLRFPPLIVLGAIYAVTLFSNILLAARWQHEEPHSRPARRAFIGFLLFAACDLCVAISYLASIHFFPIQLYATVGFFAWPFYFPSQVFICSSGKTVIQ